MEIKEQVALVPYTKFNLGGDARYFIEVLSREEVISAILFAEQHQLPIFVLGGGSNILVSDEGFPGVVIFMQSENINWDEEGKLVVADAGVAWDVLVAETITQGCFGLETLSGIPGKVGGAALGNIGAYGNEVKKTIRWVEAVDVRTKVLKRFSNSECAFSYRQSFFKTDEGKNYIILRVAFELSTEGILDRSYKDIGEYEKQFGVIDSLEKMRNAILEIRKGKFPSDGTIGTAGSFFKNPIVDKIFADEFLQRYPSSPAYRDEHGNVKLSAAWIIDNVLHLRGVRRGAVGSWESQALVLVNYGGARTHEVIAFAQEIISKCKNATGITLEPEVVFVGAMGSNTEQK